MFINPDLTVLYIFWKSLSPAVNIMWTCDMQPSVPLKLDLPDGVCFLPVATKTMTFINFAVNVKINSNAVYGSFF